MTVATDPIVRNATALAAYLDCHDPSALSPDATFVDAASGLRWEGEAAIAGMLHWFYRVAFDAHLEDTRLIVGLDGAVLEAMFVGRHQAEFAGVAATGAEVRVPLVVVYDLSDGAIASARIHFDVASFAAQAAAGSATSAEA
jgi:predicted ester cyclase